MTHTDANKSLVADFIDALFNRGEPGAVDRYLAGDYVNHDPTDFVADDREAMRAAATTFRNAFPDWHSTPHMLIGEGDLVVEVFTASGTHRNELMGIPPTGRTVTLRGINIFRVREGLITERWGRLDDLGLLQQLDAARV